ncbi:uncharacterized protein SPAPADRAFT_48767 [Spathaspora passalidarum NRRL Y-27907]|uniref:LicD/FKTN/FKRP nucleotidyltransferase domain-containing protein n=1 Tax=Spathaspora passalidarum (strain NRRL Y-27907 / 11-Y1) TaxID=619300 RepID=G3AEX6_SPAPN|nr:uncharacterized protein SPAPADRAFT_48767 [Spathaspora passalidarum NRRL Y-27907]EGW35806.1 hypothetical protein SPAPADRAFT_48767 [Spathaspora passalidarum NRRL Y-27907]
MFKNMNINKLFKIIPIVLCINTIGILLYYNSHLRHIANNLDYVNALPQTGFTSPEITKKLKSILSFKPHKVTSEVTIPTDYFETEELVQDPRVTFAITLNWIYHQIKVDPENVSFPFNWADWVDLTYLNHQISKPVNEKIKCSDLIEHIHFNTPDDKAKSIADPMFFGCKNTQDLTEKEMEEMGLTNLDRMPGFFQFYHTVFKPSEFIRMLQGKTYLLSKMPLPHQVIFLNDAGDDLTFQVDGKTTARELLKTYITNNSLEKNKIITLDPIKEFQQLLDLQGANTYENLYDADKIYHMSRSWFHYGSDNVTNQIERLTSQEELTPIERGYLTSLIISKEASEKKPHNEPMFFNTGTFRKTSMNNDDGGHYDWRFINGRWRDRYRHAILLERLLRSWFKFCQKNGIVSWINFGSLLGWYRNGAIYPFDLDMDIQMSMYHMTILGKKFNQTLVVEDLHEGTGKYFIEVGTFIHNRNKIGRYLNHIDARLIDADSGLYIDLTALATETKYSDVHPKFFKDICDDRVEGPVLEDDGDTEVYNDRNDWVYKFGNLSPLRLTFFEGVPFYVPKQIVKRMKFQYPCGTLNNFEFKQWYYIEQVGTWIHEKELFAVLNVAEIKKKGKINIDKVKKQVENLTDEQLYTLISNDPATLSNYQLARRTSGFHTKEHQYLFTIDPELHKGINDPPEGKVLDASPEENPEYLKLIEDNVWLRAPHRESIFEYERVKGMYSEFNELALKELDKIAVSKSSS